MIAWLMDRWHAYQRKLDLDILWPACKREAYDQREHLKLRCLDDGTPIHWLDAARAAFAVHAYHDKAWLVLGHDGIAQRIDELR